MKLRRQSATIGYQVEKPVIDEHLVLFDRVLEFLAASVLGNAHVEFEMEGMYRVLQICVATRPEAVVKRVELFGQAQQLQALSHRCMHRAQPRRLCFQGFAYDALPSNLFRSWDPHPGSGAWAAFEQSLIFQLPECLGYGQQAHAEFCGKPPSRQRLSGAQFAAQDTFADAIVSLVRQRDGKVRGRYFWRFAHLRPIENGLLLKCQYDARATKTAGISANAPQNPYIGEDNFRILQRIGHPIKVSLFSVILGQHEQTLKWLSTLPFVDPKRIGFYGLSYGGKTAVRVPPLLDGYALSICSGDFNEWVWKTTTVLARQSYLLTKEYDMYEFDFANTVNYAELAELMAPRPFMVERGHDDPVGLDEWVAFEYAKVREFYDKMGIGDRTEIEFFSGPHEVHRKGTFRFLKQHLQWPE